MNEEELPINKNYKELKRRKNKQTSDIYTYTYLIYLLTFSIHNQGLKLKNDHARHDHREDQVPNKIIQKCRFFFCF
jgi:hypothetical protein